MRPWLQVPEFCLCWCHLHLRPDAAHPRWHLAHASYGTPVHTAHLWTCSQLVPEVVLSQLCGCQTHRAWLFSRPWHVSPQNMIPDLLKAEMAFLNRLDAIAAGDDDDDEEEDGDDEDDEDDDEGLPIGLDGKVDG